MASLFKSIMDNTYNLVAGTNTSEEDKLLNETNKLQIGENGTAEYAWDPTDIHEHMVQIYFQLTRDTKTNYSNYYSYSSINNYDSNFSVNEQFDKLLEKLFNPMNIGRCKTEIQLAYIMTAQTRDIKDGKGERDLFYGLVYSWSNYDIELSKYLLKSCVEDNENERSLGSWADLKKMANYIKKRCKETSSSNIISSNKYESHPLVRYIIKLYANQLMTDYHNLKSNDPEKMKKITLCAKWVPKESQYKFVWLAKLLAVYISNEIGNVDKEGNLLNKKDFSDLSSNSGFNPNEMNTMMASYKRIHTPINKYLGTVQINMCCGEWSEINFKEKLTGQTGVKFRKAFLNKDKSGETRHPSDEDRVECAKNYQAYLDSITRGETKAKVDAVSITNIVGKAFKILDNSGGHYYFNRGRNRFNVDLKNILKNEVIMPELKALEAEWNQKVENFMYSSSSGNGNEDKNENSFKKVMNMVPLVDTSGSMSGFPMIAAMSLGMFVSEISTFKNRVLTFETNPRWIEFEDSWGFIEKVCRLIWSYKNNEWGGSTDFKKALLLILNVAKENNIPAEEMKGMTLAIFSDMQIDEGDRDYGETMYQFIKTEYNKAGYDEPHILFWNLRQTTGVPNLSSNLNTSMMSGASDNLIKFFLDKGMDALQDYTPYKQFVEQMMVSRYEHFRNYLSSHM